jgi:methylmalonyl-CoA/ethylmalonyl-CoA epimerase
MRVKRVEHVAIAVRNLPEVMEVFQDKLGLRLEYEEDFPQYATKIAMYPVGETYLELLAATGASSDVATWIGERGQGLYHICLEVDDIEGALDELKGRGVRLLDERPRIGHGGSLIAFIDPRSTADVLVELMQAPAGAAAGPHGAHAR